VAVVAGLCTDVSETVCMFAVALVMTDVVPSSPHNSEPSALDTFHCMLRAVHTGGTRLRRDIAALSELAVLIIPDSITVSVL
jgi:hypothetical protein